MSIRHTTEDRLNWHNSLPSKHIASHMLCWNDEGKLLFVMPDYEDYWQLPGGVVEKDESPLNTAIRETKEEIGLLFDRQAVHFVGVDYAVRYKEWDDFLHFYFSVGILKPKAIQHIGEAAEKLHGTQFLSSHQLPVHVSPQRLQTYQALFVEGNKSGLFVETDIS